MLCNKTHGTKKHKYGMDLVADGKIVTAHRPDMEGSQCLTDKRLLYRKVFTDAGYNSLCRKAISTKLLADEDYSAFYNISLGEDLLQSIAYYKNCARVYFLEESLYNYTVNLSNMVIAAGHFKQTQVAAYGEAVINIVVSIVLVVNFGLVGVAIGTFLAALFRMVYYAVYLSGNIFFRPFKFFVRRCVINGLTSMVVCFAGVLICRCFAMSDYFMWAICGVVVTMIALAVTLFANFIFYRDDFKRIIFRKSKLT